MEKEAAWAWPHSHSVTRPVSSQRGTLSSNHSEQLLHLKGWSLLSVHFSPMSVLRAHLSSHLCAQQQSTRLLFPPQRSRSYRWTNY